MNLTGYDHNNVFAKIIRGEIPSTKIYENDSVLCINDIYPQAPIHYLLMPKGPFVDIDIFSRHASDNQILELFRTLPKLQINEPYSVHINTRNAPLTKQEIFHLHLHVMSNPAAIDPSFDEMYILFEDDVVVVYQGVEVCRLYMLPKNNINDINKFFLTSPDDEIIGTIRAIPNILRVAKIPVDRFNLSISNNIWCIDFIL